MDFLHPIYKELYHLVHSIKVVAAIQDVARHQMEMMTATEAMEYIRRAKQHLAHRLAAHLTRDLASQIEEYIEDKTTREEVLETGDLRYRVQFAVLTGRELERIKLLLSMLSVQAAGPSASQSQTKPPTYPEVVEVLSLPAPSLLLSPPKEE